MNNESRYACITKQHYGNVEANTLLTVATLLDLHFKDKFFSMSDTKTKTFKSNLLQVAWNMKIVLHQYLPQSDQDKVKAYGTALTKSLKSQMHVC